METGPLCALTRSASDNEGPWCSNLSGSIQSEEKQTSPRVTSLKPEKAQRKTKILTDKRKNMEPLLSWATFRPH